jgi:hypothetical protein
MPPQRPWNAADRPGLRGALGFTLGGVVGLSVSAANMSRHGFLLPAAGFFFSGVIGLVSLFPFLNGRLQAIRAAVGFGLGFLLASGVLLISLLPLQGMSGRNPLAPTALLIVGCTIAFGVAGLVGGLFLWSGGRMVLPSAASFAAGGATGGVLLALLFAAVVIPAGERGIGRTRAKLTILTPGIACVLVSYAVGGALFGRALARRQSGTASTGAAESP